MSTNHAALASEWAMKAQVAAEEGDEPTLNLAYSMANLHAQVATCVAMTAQAATQGQFPDILAGLAGAEAARTPAGPDARERAAGMDRDEETDR